MRGAIARAERLAAALTPAVTGVDLAGLSWRSLRAFQRGAGCLADCRHGHTYGPWCQLGFPLPGPRYLVAALAEVTMGLTPQVRALQDEQWAAIHAALTQIALTEIPPVDTELAEVAERLAEHPLVEQVQLLPELPEPDGPDAGD